MVLGDSLAQLLSKSQGFDAFRILLFPFALLVGQLGEGLSSFCIFTVEQVTILPRIDCSIQAPVFLELHLLEGFGRESSWHALEVFAVYLCGFSGRTHRGDERPKQRLSPTLSLQH